MPVNIKIIIKKELKVAAYVEYTKVRLQFSKTFHRAESLKFIVNLTVVNETVFRCHKTWLEFKHEELQEPIDR